MISHWIVILFEPEFCHLYCNYTERGKMVYVSVTFMNHVLNTNIDFTSEKYLYFQSGCEIWPVASFRVF